MSESIYYTAQICENGHVINPEIDNWPGEWPGKAAFCSICGAKTLTACPNSNCNRPIRGRSLYSSINYSAPSYCPHCGSPFPWTVSAIKGANELAVQIKMDEMDRTELPNLIENLVRQTPRTPVAAARLSGLLQKVSPLAAEGFKQILIGVVTEGAKKMLWP
jgi:hypothetical protein